jgi:hypothetical protein
MNVMEWLLDSDVAIRWQVMRDLTDAPAEAVAAERSRVAREGIAVEILDQQREDGTWRKGDDRAWLTTLFTMQMLRATGVDPADERVKAAVARLESGVRWNDREEGWELRPAETGGNTFFQGEEEPCINGGALAAGSYLGRPTESLARLLVSEQLEDGGWNCEAPRSKRSSFNTTICVLEGLLEYERAVGQTPEVSAALRRGEQYLLERGLFRRLSTGEVIDAKFLEFAFPPRYHYDVLRGLDYLRGAGVTPDERVADAVKIVESKRQADGRWLLDANYDETSGNASREAMGEPSRWNTLRAMRVLRWAQGG